MPLPSKYKKAYTKQLLNGLRKDGKIIEEICAEWGVTRKTYNNWKEAHPEFAEACEVGERDWKCWWAKRYRNIATGIEPGNAAMMNLTAKNVLGYVDKQEVEHKHEEQIHTLVIKTFPTLAQRIIEHDQPVGNLLDGKPE